MRLGNVHLIVASRMLFLVSAKGFVTFDECVCIFFENNRKRQGDQLLSFLYTLPSWKVAGYAKRDFRK